MIVNSQVPLTQSIKFCSDNETSLPLFRKFCASSAPLAANAQQLDLWQIKESIIMRSHARGTTCSNSPRTLAWWRWWGERNRRMRRSIKTLRRSNCSKPFNCSAWVTTESFCASLLTLVLHRGHCTFLSPIDFILHHRIEHRRWHEHVQRAVAFRHASIATQASLGRAELILRQVGEFVGIQVVRDQTSFEVFVVNVDSARVVFENGLSAVLLLGRCVALVVFCLRWFVL